MAKREETIDDDRMMGRVRSKSEEVHAFGTEVRAELSKNQGLIMVTMASLYTCPTCDKRSLS